MKVTAKMTITSLNNECLRGTKTPWLHEAYRGSDFIKKHMRGSRMSEIPFIEKSIRSLISVVGFPLSICQTLLSKYRYSQYKPQGRLLRVGQRKLHAVVTGENIKDTPAVVLESGMGGCSLDWSLVQPELTKHATVISYDRAGFGWSAGTIHQPTCRNYVQDLRFLLKELNINPPYIIRNYYVRKKVLFS